MQVNPIVVLRDELLKSQLTIAQFLTKEQAMYLLITTSNANEEKKV